MAALIVFVLSQRSEENLHRDFRPDRHPYTPDPLRFSTRGAASHLSSELGFSKELHELNIRGFVLVHEKVFGYVEREWFVLRQKSAAASCN
jgi:hypothetical protein